MKSMETLIVLIGKQAASKRVAAKLADGYETSEAIDIVYKELCGEQAPLKLELDSEDIEQGRTYRRIEIE